jgi:hypothetical protein
LRFTCKNFVGQHKTKKKEQMEHKPRRPQFFKPAVSSRFSSVICWVIGHKLMLNEFQCCRCKTVLYEPPKIIEKKIEILIKDEYDEKFGSMLEYGIVSPFNYYKTKKFVLENDFTF